MGVAIVSDTCHYLPRETLTAEGIHEVSLYVRWPEGAQRECDILDYDAYYHRLATEAQLPTTSSRRSVTSWPSTNRCSTRAMRSSRSIWPAACRAPCAPPSRPVSSSASAPGRVFVFDSATACGGEGLVILAAAAAARGGASGAEVLERAREARAALKMWFAIDTLEYLRRGGRIAGAQAWLGSALKIKPILTVESEITPIERVRTSKRAFERMVELLQSRAQDGADAWMVQHIQAPAEAERLAARGTEIFGVPPKVISEIGPVIGTHVGPGLLGAGGLPSALLT